MSFFELINMQKLRKAILYLFCSILALWLQTMILSRNGLLGVKPLFLPAVAVTIGMFEGGVWGGVFGILLGIGCDLSFSGSTVMFLVLFAAFGFFSGLLTEFYINRRFLAWLLLSILALLFTAVCQIVPLWIFRGASLKLLIRIGLLQCLWSLPFAVLSYFVIKAVAGRARERLGS